jgi:hypothetical protein
MSGYTQTVLHFPQGDKSPLDGGAVVQGDRFDQVDSLKGLYAEHFRFQPY